MRAEAGNVRLVSGERLGDELSKLLLGGQPAQALRLARDTGVLAALLPELDPAMDEHTFTVVQAAADAGGSLPVRLAALLHDSGKPSAPDTKHAARSAELGRTLDALLDAVVDDPSLNTRDELLGRAKALAG